jgi:hypothetical protein
MWSRIPRGLHVSSIPPRPMHVTLLLTHTSTPWLTTRRRTCPICKGDVVRSLARGQTSSPRYEAYRDDSDDDIQTQAAQAINSSPNSARRISLNGDASDDLDLERGVDIVQPTPTRPRTGRPTSWRSLFVGSLGSSSRSARSPPQEDRNR